MSSTYKKITGIIGMQLGERKKETVKGVWAQRHKEMGHLIQAFSAH